MNDTLLKQDKLIIKNIDSPISICTLWTPLEKVLEAIKDMDFFIIGHCTTIVGANIMAINILSNPKIKTLIILTDDNWQDSLQAALRLPELMNNLLVNVANTDFRISDSNFSILECKLEELSETMMSADIPKQIRPSIDLKTWYTSKVSKRLGRLMARPCGPYYVHGKDLDNVWNLLMRQVIMHGVDTIIGMDSIIELISVSSTVDEGSSDKFYTLASKHISEGELKEYMKRFESDQYFHPKHIEEGMVYQYRARIDIPKIVSLLEEGSKRIYWPIFLPSDVDKTSKPCCVSIQFISVAYRLNMICTFRSQDVARAWLPNMLGFRIVHEDVIRAAREIRQIDYTLGSICFNTASAHIYKSESMPDNSILEYKEPKEYYDPEGYCIVEKDKVTFYDTCSQEELIEFRESNTDFLIDQVAEFINSRHAAYVAKELTKLNKL